MRYASHILRGVLVHAVPATTGKLLASLRDVYGSDGVTMSAEVEYAIHRSIRVGSWMGGDRDGNPFVTAEITAEALRRYRAAILEHYRDALQPVIEQLTISNLRQPVSEALEASIERDLSELSELRARTEGRNTSERYRLKLNAIAVRVEQTLAEDHAREPGGKLGGYADAHAMKADLELVRSSLREHLVEAIGNMLFP